MPRASVLFGALVPVATLTTFFERSSLRGRKWATVHNVVTAVALANRLQALPYEQPM
jgi:hypothetical protein